MYLNFTNKSPKLSAKECKSPKLSAEECKSPKLSAEECNYATSNTLLFDYI